MPDKLLSARCYGNWTVSEALLLARKVLDHKSSALS